MTQEEIIAEARIRQKDFMTKYFTPGEMIPAEEMAVMITAATSILSDCILCVLNVPSERRKVLCNSIQHDIMLTCNDFLRQQGHPGFIIEITEKK